MRRFPVVIGATVAGLASVLGYHSRSTEAPLPSAAPTLSGGGHHTTPSTAPAAKKKGRASATSPVTGAGANSATTTAPSQSSQSSHAAGKLEQYGYGELSVRVHASGSKITNVSVGKLRTADAYSQQLAQRVIPVLRREVLAKQSAHIDGITGATYTSEAYATSVQSALDHLHLP